MLTGIDREKLASFIAARIGATGDSLDLQPISGGQSNPTFLVTAGDRKLVLRMQPPGELLPSAHAIDREFRVMSALRDSDIPTPLVLCYSDDRSIVGTPFYLMEFVAGRVFTQASLPGVAPQERRRMYFAAVETLARLHNVDWQARGLGDFGRPGNYFQRQVNRWTKQWQSSKNRDVPAIDKLIAWLPAHIPDDERTVICHGDYRIGNLMFHPDEPRVVSIFDWELSTLGHPLADLAFFCIPYHTAPSEYGGILGLDLAALGIPAQDEIVARYMKTLGREEDLLSFHLAFALFRFAVIFAGIEARVAHGNAAGANAADTLHLSDAFSARACSLVGL